MPPRKRTAKGESATSKRHKDAQHTSVATKLNTAETKFSMQSVQSWFRKYKEPDEDIIGPEGMMRFCSDIKVPPEDIIMLIIAWLAQAKRAGYFTLDEWAMVMRRLNTDSAAKLIAKKNELPSLISDKKDFKDIFRFSFDFARATHAKNLDIETAKGMLQLLLADRWTELPHFIRFLEEGGYKVINRDQWLNIYEFCAVVAADLANYDVNGAWPVLLDEYVDWRTKTRT